MKSILFSINEPDRKQVPEYQKWRKFVEETADELLPNKSLETIAFGSWLLLSDDALPILGRLIDKCERDTLAYSTVFFDKETHIVRRQPKKLD